MPGPCIGFSKLQDEGMGVADAAKVHVAGKDWLALSGDTQHVERLSEPDNWMRFR